MKHYALNSTHRLSTSWRST